MFYRRGHVYWRIVIPVCIGSVAFSYLGALVNAMVESRLLTIIIAAVIIFSGAWLLLPARRAEGSYRDGYGAPQQALLLAIGALSGFGSGLSGAGGAVFCVPLMLIFGFMPFAAIGTSQVLQIVVATSGTIGNLQYGSVDFMAAAWVAVFALAGVAIGVRTAHAASALVSGAWWRACVSWWGRSCWCARCERRRGTPCHAPCRGAVRFLFHGAVRVFGDASARSIANAAPGGSRSRASGLHAAAERRRQRLQ
jgi:hypothetical protein